MIKKILLILFMCFILSGCQPDNVVDDKTYQYEVQATTENIEKYYHFTPIMNLTSDGYEITIEMKPRI